MKFLSRSLLILFALYGLVFAVGNAFLAEAGAPLWAAFAFAVVMIGVQYLVGPWLIQLLLDIRWDDDGSELPARHREFIERLCCERGLKVPPEWLPASSNGVPLGLAKPLWLLVLGVS